MSMGHSPKASESCEYLVTNSFHCGLQPKRASNDVHLYLLLHKKILRKAVIDKRYQENLLSFQNTHSPHPPGFRGRSRLPHSQHKPSKHNESFRIKSRATTCQFELHQHPANLLIEQRRVCIGHNPANRPNMMYNLTLYRKSFRKHEAKSNSHCLRVLEDYQKMLNLSADNEDHGRQRRVKTLM